MKKGIIFDMDGTMFDTEAIYQKGWHYVAELYGQADSEEFRHAIRGTSGDKLVKKIEEYYPEVDPAAYIRSCAEYMEEQTKVSVPEKLGLHEILDYAKEQGWKMAVASSSDKKIIMNNLKVAEVLDYFDAVACGDEVENSKPAPDIFLMAAELIGLKPEECYVIEDAPNGVRAGVAAGCTTILVPDIDQPDEEMRTISHGIYDSLLDVFEAMKQGEI